MIKKNPFFLKNKDIYIYTVPTSQKLHLSCLKGHLSGHSTQEISELLCSWGFSECGS